MTSITLPRRAHILHSIRKHRNNHTFHVNDEELDKYGTSSEIPKPSRALSYEESRIEISPSTSNNRFKQICSRLKHRFSISKDRRTLSEDDCGNTSERRMSRFKSYNPFSTTKDESVTTFDWPDFEKIYDTISPCLINALPGLDDYTIEEDTFSSLLDLSNFQHDETDDYSIEQRNLFKECKRGKDFRRNAICQKIDKTQYNSQLDTFIQQLMIEKLMRTWT